MTGDEHEAQKIVANVIVKSSVQVRHRHFLRLELATELRVFAVEQLVSPEMVNRAMLGGGHQPGARVVWDARLRPLFQRSHKSIVCEVLSDTNIAHHPHEP